MGALHALIVGVSAYPHLPGGEGHTTGPDYGLQQLSAPAASAVAIRSWLEGAASRLAVPLGSVRTLLSPSATELAADPSLAQATGANYQEFFDAAQNWRRECESDPDNIAFFYFAGHGVQRTRSDSVLLLSDFGDRPGNPLLRAVDVNNLFGGMASSTARPAMARTQLWFVDACRAFPGAFANFQTLQATAVFEVELSEADERCAPVYFGAVPGGNAYSVPGDRTLFSMALLESLEHSGGVKPVQGVPGWQVTTGSLLDGMQASIADINERLGGSQRIWDGGQMEDPDRSIVHLDRIPEVPVSLEVSPASAGSGILVAVTNPDGTGKLGPAPLEPNPYKERWSAGLYGIATMPSLPGVEPTLPVVPPRCFWRASVP